MDYCCLTIWMKNSRTSDSCLFLLSLQNKEEDIYGSENPYRLPASQEDEIYAQLKTWGVQAIPHKDVK